jgi:lysophospholipase L1-like esterase
MKKSRWLTLLLFLCSLVVCAGMLLAATWGMAWIFVGHDPIMRPDMRLFMVQKPNLDLPGYKGDSRHKDYRPHPVRTNELGLRNAPIAEKGKKFRILCLGGSTTWGFGVEDDQTWPVKLQGILNSEAQPVEVINAGVTGYVAPICLRYLETRGLALKPDLVLAMVGQNDQSRVDDTDKERAILTSRTLMGVIFHAIAGDVKRLLGIKAIPGPKVSPGVFSDTLAAMNRLCTDHGVRLVLVASPNLNELGGTEKGCSYRALMTDMGELTHTPVIDLYDTSERTLAPLFFDDNHFTPRGYEIISECVAAELGIRFGLMPRPDWTPGPPFLVEDVKAHSGTEGVKAAYDGVTAALPHLLASRVWLGRVLARGGEMELARAEFFKGMQESPDDIAAYEAFDQSLGDGEQRVQAWQQVRSDLGSNSFAECFLGMALLGAGRADQALETLARNERSFDQAAQARLAYIAALCATKAYDTARAQLATCRDRGIVVPNDLAQRVRQGR